MEPVKKVIEYVKEFIGKKGKKKFIENCVIFIIIGIIIIIAGGSIFGRINNTVTYGGEISGGSNNNNNSNNNSSNNNSNGNSNNSSSETSGGTVAGESKADLESRMQMILSQIQNAGRVDVMITYASGNEIVPAYDTKKSGSDTVEKDSGGGTRSISQENYESSMVYKETRDGNKNPVVLKEIQPVVKGAVIVADGAADPVVRENLCKAAQVLLDVPIHKVRIFERKK